jgi:hypothetical protein
MKPPGLLDSQKLGSGGGGGCAAGIGDVQIEGANDHPSVEHGPPGSGGGPVAPGANRSSGMEPVARPTADERQFQRFLEAADDLGSNLTSIFHDAFLKMVAPSVGSATPDTGAATPVTAPAPRPQGSVTQSRMRKPGIGTAGRPRPGRMIVGPRQPLQPTRRRMRPCVLPKP